MVLGLASSAHYNLIHFCEDHLVSRSSCERVIAEHYADLSQQSPFIALRGVNFDRHHQFDQCHSTATSALCADSCNNDEPPLDDFDCLSWSWNGTVCCRHRLHLLQKAASPSHDSGEAMRVSRGACFREYSFDLSGHAQEWRQAGNWAQFGKCGDQVDATNCHIRGCCWDSSVAQNEETEQNHPRCYPRGPDRDLLRKVVAIGLWDSFRSSNWQDGLACYHRRHRHTKSVIQVDRGQDGYLRCLPFGNTVFHDAHSHSWPVSPSAMRKIDASRYACGTYTTSRASAILPDGSTSAAKIFLDLDFFQRSSMDMSLSILALDWLRRMVLYKASQLPLKPLFPSGLVTAIEFGSGKSTGMLAQLKAAYNMDSVLKVVSYDDSAAFAASGHTGVDVRIRPLGAFSDSDFDAMFDEGAYNRQRMSPAMPERHFPQRNCWYNLDDTELATLCAIYENNRLTNRPFDVVVVDGPNGNGRSLAFLAIKHCMGPGTLILVDDVDHFKGTTYDFEQRLRRVTPVRRLHFEPSSVKGCGQTNDAGTNDYEQCSQAGGEGTPYEFGRFAVYEVLERDANVERNDIQACYFGRRAAIEIDLTAEGYSSQPADFNSSAFWERRYAAHGDSGLGSRGQMADYKAQVVNSLIREKRIWSVVEFGCGDGENLQRYTDIPQYLGLDVSTTAIEQRVAEYRGNSTRHFLHFDGSTDPMVRADLSMSLDVLYHLIEPHVWADHLELLFDASRKWVLIYAVDEDEFIASHVLFRRFTPFIQRRFRCWHLQKTYERPAHVTGTTAKFFLYERKPCCMDLPAAEANNNNS